MQIANKNQMPKISAQDQLEITDKQSKFNAAIEPSCLEDFKLVNPISGGVIIKFTAVSEWSKGENGKPIMKALGTLEKERFENKYSPQQVLIADSNLERDYNLKAGDYIILQRGAQPVLLDIFGGQVLLYNMGDVALVIKQENYDKFRQTETRIQEQLK
jgi:hypothetical protein